MSSTNIEITYPTLDEVIKEQLIRDFEKQDDKPSSSYSSSKTMELRRGKSMHVSNKKYQSLLTDKTRSAQSKVQKMVDNILLASQKDLIFNGGKWVSMKSTSGMPYHNIIYEGRVERNHTKDCDRDTMDVCVCPPKEGVKNYGSFFFANRLYQRIITTVNKELKEGREEGVNHALFSIFSNRMSDVPNYRIKNVKDEDLSTIDLTTIDINDIEPIEDMSHEKGIFPWIIIDIPKISTRREGFVPYKPVVTEAEHTKKLREHLQTLINKYSLGEKSMKTTTKEYETIPCMIDIYSFNVIRQFNWEPLILERDLNFEGDLNTICGIFFVPNNYPNSSDQDYIDLDKHLTDVENHLINIYSQKIRLYSESLIKMTDDIDKIVQLKNLHSNLHDIPNLPKEDVIKHKGLIDDITNICTNLTEQSKSDSRISQIHTLLSNIKLYSTKLIAYNNKMKNGVESKKLEYIQKEFKKTQKKLEDACNELNIIIEDFKMTQREDKYEKTMSQFVSEIFKGSDTMYQEVMKQILASEGVSKINIVPNEKFEESFNNNNNTQMVVEEKDTKELHNQVTIDTQQNMDLS